MSPQRYGEFELVGEGTEVLSAVDPETFSETLDVDVTEGTIEDLAGGGVVVSEQRAEDDGLAMGDILEMRFARTGVRKLPIVGIYADDTLYSEGFLVGLDTYVANFTGERDTRADQRGEGVSTEEASATVRRSPSSSPTSTSTTVPAIRQTSRRRSTSCWRWRPATPRVGGTHRAARRRQHADAVDR